MNFWRTTLTSVLILCSSMALVQAEAPFNKEQFFHLATLAAQDGQYDQSIGLYKKVLEFDPRFAPAYNGIGLVYQSRPDQDLVEAARYFELAVAADPSLVEGWNNLGRINYSAGAFIEAETAFLKSLEINNDQADVHLILAWVYLIGQSRPGKAIEHFDAALSSLDNEMAYYGRGMSYVLEGQRYKVFDEITSLRKRGRNDLAQKLESMLSQKAKFISEEGKPLVMGTPEQASVFEEQLKVLGVAQADGDPGGIKVRLKGPLKN